MTRKSLIIVFLIVLILSISTKIYAEEIKYKKVEYTAEYQEWLELSEKEKQQTIMPRMIEVPKSENKQTRNYYNLKTSNMARYSLKDIIPANMTIKNQYLTNTCWAFVGIAALESNLAMQDYKKGLEEKIYDFSERHVEYSTTRLFKNNQINTIGHNRQLNAGGNTYILTSYLTNGTGAINESQMPFENNSNQIELSKIQNKTVETQIYDTIIFPSYDITDNTTEIKQRMKDYLQTNGGIISGIHGAQLDSQYYNNSTGAIYCDNKKDCPINHQVLIIGWDDNYEVTNFSSLHRPKKPGAWIIKNSWGTSVGDKGFMYVSYEDVNVYYDLYGIEKASASVDYDNIYQYNELGYSYAGYITNTTKVYMANEFTKKTNNVEYLTQVALDVPETCICKVYVNAKGTGKNKNDLVQVNLKDGTSKTINAGYHTLEFANPIKVLSDKFVVVIEIQGIRSDNVRYCLEGAIPNVAWYDYAQTQNSKCFVATGLSTINTKWQDLSKLYNADSTIKAFTVNMNEVPEEIPEEVPEEVQEEVPEEIPEEVQEEKPQPEIKTVPNISYRTHVENIGWQNYVKDGTLSGTTGKSYRLEGINIKLQNNEYGGGIKYQTHIQNIGWQNYVRDGNLSGTTGKALRLEAIKIQLTGEISNYYDVYYRVHCQNFGWLDWAKNGEAAGSSGYSYRLESIQICLVKKGGSAPGSTANAYKQPYLKYQTHVQNIGWQDYAQDGEMSGTSGKSLRLEGIKISLTNQIYEGGIEYSTHIQNIGWQGYKKNGDMSGTSGKSLRLEAIKIRLTGKMAEKYDIYYCVHAQNVGWMGWAKNGESAGTAGFSYRLEGIKIYLVEKGGAAPGRTSNCFISK